MNCEIKFDPDADADYKEATLLYEPVIGDMPECMEFILDLDKEELGVIYDWIKNPALNSDMIIRMLDDNGDVLKTFMTFNCCPIALVVDDCFNKLVVQYSKASDEN